LFYLKRFREIVPLSTHIKGVEMIQISYRTSPEIVREVLPPPLEPGPEPLASVYIARFAETDFGSPAYSEGALFLQARHKEVIGNYCLAMYVTDDIALIRGREVYGFPKKLAQVRWVREGSRLEAAVERRGCTVMTIKAETVRPVKPEARTSVFGGTTFLFKYFINPECTGYDFEPRLVGVSIRETVTKLEECKASIFFGKSKVDPLYRIEACDIVSALYLEGDMELPPAKVLAEVKARDFTPYAFFRLK